MSRTIRVVVMVTCVASLAMAGPKGTVPRSSADRYAAHAMHDSVGIGVVVLSSELVRKEFVSDVNRCCVVAEIALYPAKDKSLDVSLNDFVLRVKGAETSAKPASARVIAARLQKNAGSDRDITVSPTVGVGYESAGYDPVTGTRGGGGVTRSAGVMVGIGGNGPKPASTDKDRAVMETELSEKGLPEGTASTPVSGYVYFPITRKKNTSLQLEYVLHGSKVVVALPQ